MKAVRVVLDTNVIVSAHLNHEGYERHVLDLALTGKIALAVSEKILAEYEGVLRRAKFSIPRRYVSQSMRLLRASAKLVNPRRNVAAAHDPDDNRFLECAEAARADYLVTGNKRHFPKHWRGTQVVNARELIERLVPELQR
jgi:putative PIN family toxin of toxin-antitoxin system